MNFTTGCQPCNHFTPRESDSHGFTQRHECYSPDASGSATCEGVVAFCSNCSTDHHSGGYQTCAGTWHTRSGPCARCEAAQRALAVPPTPATSGEE